MNFREGHETNHVLIT